MEKELIKTFSEDGQYWINVYNKKEEKFEIISPIFDVVMHQMLAMNTCFEVQGYITFTEADKNNPNVSKEM